MTRLGHYLRGLRGAANVVVAAALVLWAVGVRERGGVGVPSAFEGTYKVQAVGYGSGEGTCDVQVKLVRIDCKIRDDAGNEQQLRASNLKRENNRFRGDGALDGVYVRISGRVDPPGKAFTNPHLVATFVAEDGRSGRVVGMLDDNGN
jgi:hypothetical protein